MQVAVIGAGSWGTALAQVLAQAGNQVRMWARKPEVAASITEQHVNPRYLVEAQLSPAISAACELSQVVKDAQAILVVTPSHLLREFAAKLSPLVGTDVPICLCSKGIEHETACLPAEIFEQEMGNAMRIAVLAGPNHAEEVVYGIASGTVIASASEATALFFRDLLALTTFRCYVSHDVVGVEICAAYKNIIAIAVGASYGCGNGDNTAAMLMTRGMAEMSRLVQACGGDAMTVMGLAGAGDLIATCTSEHSRNRRFGKLIAQGGSLAQFEAETHMVVEGALACKTILPLAQRHQVELPIAAVVRKTVWEGVDPHIVGQRLIERPLTTEFWGLDTTF